MIDISGCQILYSTPLNCELALPELVSGRESQLSFSGMHALVAWREGAANKRSSSGAATHSTGAQHLRFDDLLQTHLPCNRDP